MAKDKNKQADDITPAFAEAAPVEAPAPPVFAPAPADEIDRLKAEVAAKNAEIQRLLAMPANLINPDGPAKRFRVELQHGPTWVVEAPHAALAFDVYKRETGVIGTEYEPTVSEVAADTPLTRDEKRAKAAG